MTTQITNCQFCGKDHGKRCPDVRAIEYHENGVIRRVEFMTPRDYMPSLAPMPSPGLYPVKFGETPRLQDLGPNWVVTGGACAGN